MEQKPPKKTHKQKRIEMLDRHFNQDNNPDLETPKIGTAEIMDGADAQDLAESMRTFELKSGDRILAGTDKGIGYGDRNEDRVVLSPKDNVITVIDGMGGEKGGEVSAQILAESILKNPNDISRAVDSAVNKMESVGIKEGGAVFISAKIRTEGKNRFLDVFQAGDCKLFILKKNGEIGFESVDQSDVQSRVSGGNTTPDEALYDANKHLVSNPVSPNNKRLEVKSYESVAIEGGDLVLLMSDGLSDNFTAEEIASARKKYNLSPDALFTHLSNEGNERMKNINEIYGKSGPERTAMVQKRKEEGIFSDGYKSAPKKDNRALVIIEIKNPGEVELVPASSIEDRVRDERIEALKKRENELRNAIEKLRQQILALPDEKETSASAETVRNVRATEAKLDKTKKGAEKDRKEAGPKPPEIKTFSTSFIKERVKTLLESQDAIKEVRSLDVNGRGKEIALKVKLSAQKGVTVDVDIEAILESKAGVIKVKSHRIDANWLIKGTVEGIVVPKLNQVSELLKSYIEEEEERKVDKIEIENGKLKVTFGK